MHPQITSLTYKTDTTLEYFHPLLSNHPWLILLNSNYHNYPNNRYDIMVSTPKITSIIYNGINNIANNSKQIHSSRSYSDSAFNF